MSQQAFDHQIGLGAKRPLVSNAKSSTPPQISSKIQSIRAERYMLQNSARDLFLWAGERKGLEFAANYHRTAKCSHVRHGSNVNINQSIEHGSAFFSGLVVCGNVWTCPVCAAKIQERRRLEIAKAFDYAYESDKKVVMMTFTFPHYAHQQLKDLLDRQADAFKRLRAGKPFERIKNHYGFSGLIRSLEVTLGDSGWHPHTHEAWIIDKDASAIALRNRVSRRWLTMCQRAGLVPAGKEAAFLRHAVQVTDNCSTSDYLAKQDDSRHWGADRELAKASSKTSKSAKGFHPFALLAEHAEGGKTRRDAGSRFLEYAKAMRGKRQIFWSHGLKDRVGINDKTDEQLAEESVDKAFVLAQLSAENWRLVIKYQAKSRILDAAENLGWVGICELISELEQRECAQKMSDCKSNQDQISSDYSELEVQPLQHLFSLDRYLVLESDRQISASIARCRDLTAQKLCDIAHDRLLI